MSAWSGFDPHDRAERAAPSTKPHHPMKTALALICLTGVLLNAATDSAVAAGSSLFGDRVVAKGNGFEVKKGEVNMALLEYKANLALLKGSAMVGVFLGRFRKEEPTAYEQNLDELLTMYANGQLNPVVTQTFPKEQFVEAFNIFTKRQAKGKVTLEFKAE